MSEKRRLADATILPTKAELDARIDRQQQWQRTLSMMMGYGGRLRRDTLEDWQNRYVMGALDFETFDAGLAERLQ